MSANKEMFEKQNEELLKQKIADELIDGSDIIAINPQFRSIIPCEILLYIEVTFLGFIHWYGDFLGFLVLA